MRFKIDFQSKENDFAQIIEVLSENPNECLEFFSAEEFDSVKVNPLVVAANNSGYSISSVIEFEQLIGIDVFNKLHLDKEKNRFLLVNYRNIKISKQITDKRKLETILKFCSNLIERVVNQVCNMFDELISKTAIINSESLDKKFDWILRKKELEKRAEVLKPFGTIHAKSRKDALARCGSVLI